MPPPRPIGALLSVFCLTRPPSTSRISHPLCLSARQYPIDLPKHPREAWPWSYSHPGNSTRLSYLRHTRDHATLADDARRPPVDDVAEGYGPLEEYDERVHSHRLRDDEHQRNVVQYLQDLHDMLRHYQAPPVVHPSIDSLKSSRSFLGSFFSPSPSRQAAPRIAQNLPKGLYMYGDVGSGKTMLMDLFYDTLPPNVQSKTRIHFHNFMQNVHKQLHLMKEKHGSDLDAILYVAADIAEQGSILCFDEFQCTDVADAMILRRLLEALMSHGVVLVTTSNRHPAELYKNGIQRESFIPCINLLQNRLRVINLDSQTDYRKLPRPPSGVYHHPLDAGAKTHANKWFRFLGDPEGDPPHRATHQVWGREIEVPCASGRAAMFTFDQLLRRATGAADYLELMRSYESFVVTDVPAMTFHDRDLARRFITFVDAVYESRAKLVLTTAVPLVQLFVSPEAIEGAARKSEKLSQALDATSLNESSPAKREADADSLGHLALDNPELNRDLIKESGSFAGEEEYFAFSRALSRLSEMSSQEWVERGLGMEKHGGKSEMESWGRVRSRWREDSL